MKDKRENNSFTNRGNKMEKINLLKTKLKKMQESSILCDKKEPVFVVDNNGEYAFEETDSKHFRIVTVSTLLEDIVISDIPRMVARLNKGCTYGKFDIQIVEETPIMMFRFNIWYNEEPSDKERVEMESLALGCLSLAKRTLTLLGGE